MVFGEMGRFGSSILAGWGWGCVCWVTDGGGRRVAGPMALSLAVGIGFVWYTRLANLTDEAFLEGEAVAGAGCRVRC